MALRLARLFGNSADFWLKAQIAVDLWNLPQPMTAEVHREQPLEDPAYLHETGARTETPNPPRSLNVSSREVRSKTRRPRP